MANLKSQEIAGLNCQVITTDQPPQSVAIFCHGFGAPGDDLIPIGAQLLKSYPVLLDRTQFIFPSAPISLANVGIPHGLAWWPLDVDRLVKTVENGNFRDLRNESPALLPEARQALINLISEVRLETGLPLSQIVLGGFSQGAMLATDVSLHLEQQPGGLVIWSGTLVNEAVWNPLFPKLHGLPIMQSHGQQDPILPFEAAVWLKDKLVEAGADMNFIQFRGQHSIPEQALQGAGTLLKNLVQV